MEHIRKKAAALLARCDTAVLASVDEDGCPRPVPMVALRTEGVSTVWFSTEKDSVKVRQFRADPRAGVCFYERGNMVTLTGTVEIRTDAATRSELWQPWMAEHFAGGVDDPAYCVLRFTAHRMRYWLDGDFAEAGVQADRT
ncbi:MAG: pyridoxamine 5'-phosphate oxidase family protein [Rikenellaceae bacterium]|nr:pyridoxamine 5'-phosphate oxidase family protein [Rikenellaceae bacterium]